MHCIFCKNKSDDSKSREHIVPESLGNEQHILPLGWVCDSCNNYFSRKVEAPFLDTWYGKTSRFEMGIPNKKGKIPIVTGFHPRSHLKVNLMIDKDGMSIFAKNQKDESLFINSIREQEKGSICIPPAGDPELNYETARFIGKIALEILAYKCMDVEDGNEQLVNKVELDELRNYVRQGKPGFVWPIHMRRIYPANYEFSDEIDTSFQVLNEWDILFIPSPHSDGMFGEFYAIIAILGMEYALNLGGPSIDGYMRWLKNNKNRSYLYMGKNA